MPDNHDISDILGTYAKLYELHGGNAFKIRSIAGAAYNIKKIGEPLEDMSEEALFALPQVGKSIAPKVLDIIHTGSFQELDELISQTPEGVLNLLKIKGLGPKKVEVLWKQVGIESVPDLLDACRENRLVEIKGFGQKTQEQILADIEFKFSNEGKFHWARLEKIANETLEILRNTEGIEWVELCGEIRRLNEIVHSIDLLCVCEHLESVSEKLSEFGYSLYDYEEDHAIYYLRDIIQIRLFHTEFDQLGTAFLEHSSSPEHLDEIGFYNLDEKFETEEDVYEKLGFPYIIPELREPELNKDKLELQDQLIQYSELKGVLHNHTRYSDGLNTVAEMAEMSMKMGLTYLGICDHSKTAAYANGLQEERVLQQMQEIDSLNEKYKREGKDFRIFKGIESDILGDGSLDYDEDILKLFDMVVASVHSNLNMDMDKAHLRLIKAIENPYTSILGHPTGRLLLMRKGYPIDHQYIADACIANGVAIELNAHPYRLDFDWRHIGYVLDKGGLISINPDAHQIEGLADMRYGVNVARKAMLTAEQCLNAKSCDEFSRWLSERRK